MSKKNIPGLVAFPSKGLVWAAGVCRGGCDPRATKHLLWGGVPAGMDLELLEWELQPPQAGTTSPSWLLCSRPNVCWDGCGVCAHTHKHTQTHRQGHAGTHAFICTLLEYLCLQGKCMQYVLVHRHPNSCASQNLVSGDHLNLSFGTVLGCYAAALSFLFLLWERFLGHRKCETHYSKTWITLGHT